MLEHVYQDHVQFIQEDLLPSVSGFVAAGLDNDVADIVSDCFSLLHWQRAPTKTNEIFQDLQTKEARLLALAALQDRVDTRPHLRVFLHLFEKFPYLGPLQKARSETQNKTKQNKNDAEKKKKEK